MTKLSHLPWYWQADWELNACTCGLLALVWKSVLGGRGGKKYFIIQIWFLFHVNLWHDIHFLSLSNQEWNVLTCSFDMVLFFNLSQDKQQWITPMQIVLPFYVLTSQKVRRENQPKQTENTQSMTVCNIYAKSFIQQRHTLRLLAASIIQIRNI